MLNNRAQRCQYNRTPSSQKGLITLLLTISFLFILGIVGLVIDIGFTYSSYRQSQTATDAAALAGAFEIYNGNSLSINTSALYEAGTNGFVDGSDGITITVNSPPLSGYYAGDSSSVEVIIQNDSPTIFLGSLGFNTLSYTTRAVANGNTADGQNCVYVLAPDKEKAMHVSSGSDLYANCGIHVNSGHNKGLYVDSGSSVSADSVAVTGKAYKSGSSITPDPVEDAIPAPDPLSRLTPPSVDYSNSACPNGGGKNICNATSCKGENDGSRYKPYEVDLGSKNSTVTLNPGLYCGGLLIKKGTAVLNPGTYILRGGGLVVDGSDSLLTGEGVTFYNTCESECNGNESDSQDFWPLDIKSSGTIDLSAPPCTGSGGSVCSGLEGILWFSDRNAPSTDNPGDYPSNKINSSSSADIDGAVYAWNQHLEFSSNSSSGSGQDPKSIFVTKYLEVASSSDVSIDSFSQSGGGGSSPIKRVTLVE